MNSARELLALRKEVLVARASLQRLKIGAELEALREDLRWPRAVVAIATSRPVRSALFGALLILAGRGRAARLVRTAAAVAALFKMAGWFAQRTPAAAGEGEAGGPPQPDSESIH